MHLTGDMEVIGHVVVDQLELLVSEQMGDIGSVPRDQVVDAGDLGARVDEPGADMGAEKPGPTHDHRVLALELVKPAESRTAHVEHVRSLQSDVRLHRWDSAPG